MCQTNSIISGVTLISIRFDARRCFRYDEHMLIYNEQTLIRRPLLVKYLVSFIAVVPLLMSGVALHGQETQVDAAGQDDAQCNVPMLAMPHANAVDHVAAPELNHRLNDTTCLPDLESCGRLDVAGKARYFADRSFGVGPFVGPLLWSAPILANPPAHYPKGWRQGAGRWVGCTVMRLCFKPLHRVASLQQELSSMKTLGTQLHRAAILSRERFMLSRLLPSTDRTPVVQRLPFRTLSPRPRPVSSVTPICLAVTTTRVTESTEWASSLAASLLRIWRRNSLQNSGGWERECICRGSCCPMFLTPDLVRTRCESISLTTEPGCLPRTSRAISPLSTWLAQTATVSLRELGKGQGVRAMYVICSR